MKELRMSEDNYCLSSVRYSEGSVATSSSSTSKTTKDQVGDNEQDEFVLSLGIAVPPETGSAKQSSSAAAYKITSHDRWQQQGREAKAVLYKQWRPSPCYPIR